MFGKNAQKKQDEGFTGRTGKDILPAIRKLERVVEQLEEDIAEIQAKLRMENGINING